MSALDKIVEFIKTVIQVAEDGFSLVDNYDLDFESAGETIGRLAALPDGGGAAGQRFAEMYQIQRDGRAARKRVYRYYLDVTGAVIKVCQMAIDLIWGSTTDAAGEAAIEIPTGEVPPVLRDEAERMQSTPGAEIEGAFPVVLLAIPALAAIAWAGFKSLTAKYEKDRAEIDQGRMEAIKIALDAGQPEVAAALAAKPLGARNGNGNGAIGFVAGLGTAGALMIAAVVAYFVLKSKVATR